MMNTVMIIITAYAAVMTGFWFLSIIQAKKQENDHIMARALLRSEYGQDLAALCQADYQVADVIVKYCRKPYGPEAVMNYDVLTLAHSILRFSNNYKVELGLALAQGIVESHFACDPKAGRSRKTRNIYNVGNVDDGSNKYFASYEAGVERYFQLMDKEYRWPADKDGVVRMITLAANDFQRPRGGRYASAANYTQMVYAMYKRVMKDLYPQGEPQPPTDPNDRMAA